MPTVYISAVIAIALAGGIATPQDARSNGEASPTAPDEPKTSFDLSDWMTHYRQHPEPDRVVYAISEMQASGFLSKKGHLATAFLSEVFRRSPELVANWTALPDEFSDDERHWIYLAVWWSGAPEATDVLEKGAAAASDALRPVLLGYSESTPGPITGLPLLNADRLDMLWVAFFASGNPEYVARIADGLDPPAEVEQPLKRLSISKAARWSLASNAYQHTDVFKALQALAADEHSPHSDEVHGILAEVRERQNESATVDDVK